MKNIKENLRNLLIEMSIQKNFYILGAGASYGLLPLAQDLPKKVQKLISNNGIFLTKPLLSTPFIDRILAPVSLDEQNCGQMLMNYVSESTIDLATQGALHIPNDTPLLSQYAIFDFVARNATICNFNLDGLASRYCNHRHTVLEMHGRIDSVRLEGEQFNDLLYATQAYDLPKTHLTNKVLIRPETIHDLSNNPAYNLVKNRLPSSSALIIIGYSFGQQVDSMDDTHSFDFFISLLKRYPKKIFVISPTPYSLSEILRDSLSSHNVFEVPLRKPLYGRLPEIK